MLSSAALGARAMAPILLLSLLVSCGSTRGSGDVSTPLRDRYCQHVRDWQEATLFRFGRSVEETAQLLDDVITAFEQDASRFEAEGFGHFAARVREASQGISNYRAAIVDGTDRAAIAATLEADSALEEVPITCEATPG